MPALAKRMCHHRIRKKVREMMSKWNYITSAREPIGGDECPRRQK